MAGPAGLPYGPPLRAVMAARSPHEPHRVATPLELLFDLVFVVAVAQAGTGLHHAIGEARALQGLLGYLVVFFAIWWAWMNFTWFASAYDCDDVPYRLAIFVQISGALLLAGGVRSMLDARLPNAATLGGYVVMRLALVPQWLRAARSDPARRQTAHRYALGIAALQLAWVALLFGPGRLWLAGFVVLAALELAVPAWAEAAAPTPWHPHHIAERYGLFTLIVLGESILASANAVQSALASGEGRGSLALVVVGGLLIVYALWWVYFDRPAHDALTSFGKAVLWGYGHYFIFASAAAVGAGLSVAAEQATGASEIGATTAARAVAVPVAVYLGSLWLLRDSPAYGRTRWLGPPVVGLILLTPLAGRAAVPLIALLLCSLVAVKLAMRPPAS